MVTPSLLANPLPSLQSWFDHILSPAYFRRPPVVLVDGLETNIQQFAGTLSDAHKNFGTIVDSKREGKEAKMA